LSNRNFWNILNANDLNLFEESLHSGPKFLRFEKEIAKILPEKRSTEFISKSHGFAVVIMDILKKITKSQLNLYFEAICLTNSQITDFLFYFIFCIKIMKNPQFRKSIFFQLNFLINIQKIQLFQNIFSS